jgi:hypothetical protein
MNFQYSAYTPDNSNRWNQPMIIMGGAGSGFRYSSDFLPVDTVTLSGPTFPMGGFQNDTMTRGGFTSYGFQNDSVTLGNITYVPGGPADGARMSDGRSIEDVFNNPYGADQAYLAEALEKIRAARALYGAKPTGATPGKEVQKGDLRVIAGDRPDGVKPKEVRIDDVDNYDWKKEENRYQDNRFETSFSDRQIGREYDVVVTWEDGSTTNKRVTLERPGQIVYMKDSWSY